tara:strand:+ start:8747 stop:8956 length:210 start_codon:yes stop_codon:yes gene_type:complete
MDETINWYQSIKENEKLQSVIEIARSMNAIESFTLENKKTFLSDIRDIQSLMVVLIQMKNIYMTELQKN